MPDHIPIHIRVPQEGTVGDGGAGWQLALLFHCWTFAVVVVVAHIVVVVVVVA